MAITRPHTGYLALTMDVSDGDLDGFLVAVDDVLDRYAELACS